MNFLAALKEYQDMVGIFAFTILSVITFVATKGKLFIDWKNGKLINTDRKEEVKRPSVLTHKLFELLRSNGEGNFSLADCNGNISPKQCVNEAFIRNKCKVFYHGLFDFFERIEVSGFEGLEELPKLIDALVKQYEQEAYTLLIRLPCGTILPGVPSCYNRKFKAWHSSHADIAIDGVLDAITSIYYFDKWTRVTVCCDYFFMAFKLTIEDGERTLPMLNGDFESEVAMMLGREYKGGGK